MISEQTLENEEDEASKCRRIRIAVLPIPEKNCRRFDHLSHCSHYIFVTYQAKAKST